MALAIFDLDDTLLAGDSDYEWGKFLCDKEYVDSAKYRQLYDNFYQQYQEDEYNVDEELDFAGEVLTFHDLPTLNKIHQEFMRERAEAMILPKAEALIDKHRQAGDLLMVITATLQFIVEPIVTRLGIENLIASVPEMNNGRYTGKIVGVPSFREGKVTRLEQWLGEQWQDDRLFIDKVIKRNLDIAPNNICQAGQGQQERAGQGAGKRGFGNSQPSLPSPPDNLLEQALEGSWFYSDSHNDLPLLSRVSNPVAVDPNPQLRQAATERGWQIISLR